MKRLSQAAILTLVMVALNASAPASEEELVTRGYDLYELPGFDSEPLDDDDQRSRFAPQGWLLPPVTVAEDRKQSLEWLIRTIRHEVDPASWSNSEINRPTIREKNGELVVSQTVANHELIDALLQKLHDRRVDVTIEIRFLTFDEDLSAALRKVEGKWEQQDKHTRRWSRFLTDDDLEIILFRLKTNDDRSWIVTAPRMTVPDGQRSAGIVASQTEYSDVDPATLQVVTRTVPSGVCVDVRPHVSADDKRITLAFRPQLSTLLGFDDGQRDGMEIQRPIRSFATIDTTIELPSGNGFMMLAARRRDPGETDAEADKEILILGRATVIHPD